MRLALAIEEGAGVQALRLVAESDHEVVAVLTSSAEGGAGTPAGAASELGVPLLPAERVSEASFADWLCTRAVDLLLNVHSLVVMHCDVVEAPHIGSFNLHPGPLPRYAGLNAPSWAIYNGERRHAVTLHWMAAGIDTGPIAYESWFDVAEPDTALTVAARCVRLGMPLVARLLADAERGRDAIPAVPQDLSQRHYFGGAPPDGARMVWSRPARSIVNLVRACDYAPFASPWGRPTAMLGAHSVRITKAGLTREPTTEPPGTVGAVDGHDVRVAAGDEWVAVRRLQLGDEPVTATAILEPGMRLRDGE